MRNWIAVWEATEDFPELDIPRGSHFVFHRHRTEERMVIHTVWLNGEDFILGPELDRYQMARLLGHHHHLRFVYSRPPSPALYLREAIQRAGGHPRNQALRLMA